MTSSDETRVPVSFWSQTRASHVPRRPPRRDAEIIVVGGGLAGLLTATLLQQGGADVLVVERNRVGGVATINTTGKISALQGTVYSELRRRRGDVAGAYADAQLDAVDGLAELIGALGIECSLTRAAAYTYATEPEATEKAQEEFEAARQAGLAVTWTTETDLPFAVSGAVRLDGQFHMHPGRLCDGLAEHLGTERVIEATAVRDVEERDDGCNVVLDDGSTMTAEHVVIATQGPIVDPALLVNRCRPVQSYALAARLDGPVPEGMYLSCDPSSRSLRPATLDGEQIAIVGGEGHAVGDERAQPERWEALQRWAADRLELVEVLSRWATHDLVPTDRVPFIGNLAPGSDRRWVATGFAKWGMSTSFLAAKIITERIGGGSLPWQSTFDATRIASTFTVQALPLGATAARHLIVDRLAGRHEPRCTHQGCVLRHDDALQTWDCPCHGSRFAEDGSVIQGPASAPLVDRLPD